MFISSPLIREGGWGLGAGVEEPSQTVTGSPQPRSVATQAAEDSPPIRAMLAARDHGIWGLAGSDPPSDGP